MYLYNDYTFSKFTVPRNDVHDLWAHLMIFFQFRRFETLAGLILDDKCFAFFFI